MKKIILLPMISFFCLLSFGQNAKVDSLMKVLKSAKEDTTKVNTLNSLAYEFKNNDADTAIYFANEALVLASRLHDKKGIANSFFVMGVIKSFLGKSDEALKNLNDAIKTYDQLLIIINKSEKSNVLLQKAKAYNKKGSIYDLEGNYLEALKTFFIAKNIFEEISDTYGVAVCNVNIGIINFRQGNYPEALKNNITALKTFDKIGNKSGIANAYNSIGNINKEMGDTVEALRNYFTALKIFNESGDKMRAAQAYNNIGIVYKDKRDYAESLKNHYVALKLRKEINDKINIAESYYNIGNLYCDIGNYQESLRNYKLSSKIQDEIGNKKGIATTYSAMGNIYLHLSKYSEATNYLNKGLLLAKEIGSLNDIKESYGGLALLDSLQGNFKQSLEHYKMYIISRDSIVNVKNSNKIVQSQMQYDFDKKETATKAEQDKKDALAKAELQKQKVLKYSFIGGAILLLALALVLYNRYRLKQRANNVITKAFDELKKAQGQLVQSEKMASLGQLTAGIAHEINNPINFVSANVNPLKRNYDELVEFILKKKAINEEDLNYNIVESNQLFSGIEEGATRTTEIVKGLRNFSRLDEGDFKEANINEGIDSTLMLLHNKLNERNIEVVRFPGEIPEIKCYPGQLNQVFMNVLSNAIDAIGENVPNNTGERKITISTSLENGHVKISITDTGKGMSEEVREKIFEPFFTTKDVGKGTGLGLSISYGIIEEHKGKIAVQSQTGKGAEFIITLPVS